MATPPPTDRPVLIAEPTDALAMLKADHRHIQALFAAYARAEHHVARRQIAALVCAALDLHTHLEEDIFYPAYEARTGTQGTQRVADSRVDHAYMQDLMRAIQRLGLDDAAFEAQFQELMHTVQNHVAEEEHEMFPEAAHILADQLQDLMTQMVALQQQRTTPPKA